MKLLNLNLDLRFAKRYFSSDLELKSKLKILKTKVNQFYPEVITFQEVTDVLILALLKRILRKYGFAWRGFLKVSGGVVTLYDKEKWALISQEFIAFSQQGKFFSKQLADRILRKGILVTVLKNLKRSQKLLVINLHLTANYGQKLAEEEGKILKIQLEEIKKVTKKYRLRQEIVAGDFNADFQGQVIQKWLKTIGFQAVFSPQDCTVCPATNPLCHRDQFKDYQIDNVLLRGFGKPRGKLVFNQKGDFVSDHYGQLVEAN